MSHVITFVRKWSAARDAIAHDTRCDKSTRGIYLHQWPTGHQELVFDSPADAQRFEDALNRDEVTA